MDNQIATRLSSITSWLVFIVFVVIFINMSFAPRVPTESLERKVLTNFHLVVGTCLFVFSFFRVYLWIYSPPQNTHRQLPDHEYTQIHILQFMLYVAFIAQGISGILTAWSDGLILFLPGADTINHLLWTTSGYLHSVFGFFYIALILFIIIFRIYHLVRYRVFSINIFA
jgi:cytochrome b561